MDVCRQCFFVRCIPSHFHVECNARRNGFLIAFQYAFCHEKVECGDSLTSVLLILVGLENDGSQCSVALDRLRCADASVFGMETPFE